MRVMVARNRFTYRDKPVQTYSASMVRVLREKGHEVVDIQKNLNQNYDGIDLLIDIDCGRNEKGELLWQAQNNRLPVPSAIMFIDSHGYPSLHRRLAKNYDHVFFAVWDKRDLFTSHLSAHWCPNFTDAAWFDGQHYNSPSQNGYDFGFFGSKGGLERADKMRKIAERLGWTATAREVIKGVKHRWPATSEAMAECRNLFNKGQKHDGPNLRVMESMLMQRPLISDKDNRSGMDKLFESGKHYIPYEYFSYEGLEEAMRFVMNNPLEARGIAAAAYAEVKANHLVENRIDQIINVVNSSS